jgi:biotin carboxyl carrier protein
MDMKLRITLEGRSYDVGVEVLPEQAAPARRDARVDSLPESVLRPPRPPDVRAQDKIFRTPIAGVVVAIEASPKQTVRRDDAVIVIEAMKMQNTIRAHMAGIVEEIHVRIGEPVKSGQPLFRLS